MLLFVLQKYCFWFEVFKNYYVIDFGVVSTDSEAHSSLTSRMHLPRAPYIHCLGRPNLLSFVASDGH